MKTIKKIMGAIFAMALMLSLAVPALAAGTEVKLVNLHEIESDEVYTVDDGITDSYGKTYKGNVLRFQAGEESFITYDLNGQYETFSCDIVCSTETGSDAVMNVGVFADEVLVYELKGYTRQKPAEHVSINVSGVGKLSIKTTKTSGYESWIYIVDGVISKAENGSVYPNRTMLNDLFVIDDDTTWISNRLFTDAFGNIHNGYTKFQCGEDAYILYNLDKKYVSLSGVIVAGADTGDASMNIEFYVDDKLVHSEKGIKRTTSAKTFNFDVTGAGTLKIVTSKTDGFESFLYVTDSILKVHEHSLNDWKITKNETCTDDGEKTQICKECGETVNTEKIPATGHKAENNWTVIKDATCTDEGEQIHKCTVCGEAADKETIEAKGHTANGSWEDANDGTCNKIQKCSVCGEVALRQTDEEAEHSLSGEWIVTRDARCDAEGEKVQYCTVCNAIGLVEAIPTTEHDYGKWTTISGSVWNNPIVKERTCSICGDVEHTESNSTSWLKPLVIVLFVIIFGGLAVIFVTLKMNGLAIELASIKKLFSKESLTDDDIDDILNKPDDNSDNQ